MITALVALVYGALAMGFVVAALFFHRYWRESRDRLFLWFAAAFLVLAIQRVATVLSAQWNEDTTWVYVLRLLAFLMILIGILEKNRARPRRRAGE